MIEIGTLVKWSDGSMGMVMDTPESAAAKADLIYERSVVLQTMPLGNVTEMTDEERDIVGAWYEAGAPTK